MKEFIYLSLRGETASFKVPQVYQGFLLSLPVPPYSSILGILSKICSREITPKDGRIGFRYSFQGVGKDLETYHRWERKKSGKYGYTGTAVRSREIHYKPHLELILDNTDLLPELQNPVQTPTLGRSQDIASIDELRIVQGEPIPEAVIADTLVRLEDLGDAIIPGMLYNLPEVFDYTKEMVRLPLNITRYLALTDNTISISAPNLYRVNRVDDHKDNTDDQIFYLYKWT